MESVASTEIEAVAPRTRVVSIQLIVATTLLLALAGYTVLLWLNLAPFWFNPRWTTDDAVQQIFPFHSVWHPQIFPGDLIYETMKGYLAPLHYGLGVAITYLTVDPIMTGHWMMLIQVLISSAFLFATVYALARRGSAAPASWTTGVAPAAFALLWFLHSRAIFQRMTGGLPRGWAAPILAVFLYCVATERWRAVLLCLIAGSLLNPPAAFLAGFSYGVWLLYRLATPHTRRATVRPLCELIVVTPLLFGLTLWTTHRPPEVGQMATYEEAASMPEFQRNGGRFAFLPFPPVAAEVREYAFRSFVFRLHTGPVWWRNAAPLLVTGLVAALLIAAAYRRRELIPAELIVFGISSITVYLLSRQFAFKLYVPDRHLLTPMALFFICSLPVALWRLCAGRAEQRPLLGGAALALLAAAIYLGSGTGLETTKKGTANFNYHDRLRGGVYSWVRANTPETALIAGHPIHLDPVQLFGMRRGFATSETWHPFYSGYNQEIKRRLEISFRAHFAKNLADFITPLEANGINYFIFARSLFDPNRLATTRYLNPLNELVRALTAGDKREYAYFQLPFGNREVIPFSDKQSVIVDIAALRRFLDSSPLRHSDE